MHRQRFLFCLFAMTLACPTVARADEETSNVADLKAENEQLRRDRDELEARVRRLQDELNDARSALVQAKIEGDRLEHHCRKLQNEFGPNKGEKSPLTHVVNGISAVDEKTKSDFALGKITSIGKDGRLLQISIGSIAGVKQGQALEVFRVATATSGPRPIYLGTLRLIRVDPQTAVGEFKSVLGNERRPTVGDEVASDLFVK